MGFWQPPEWSAAVNMFNKQSQTTDKVWSSSMVIGLGTKNPDNNVKMGGLLWTWLEGKILKTWKYALFTFQLCHLNFCIKCISICNP